MKENFKCTLDGKTWWKPFMVFIALFLAVYIPLELASMNPAEEPTRILATLCFTLALQGVLIVIQAAFAIILMRIVFAAISFQGKSFSFSGDIGEYVKISILGFLLCLVSLGFYIPWYMRNLTAYLVGHSSYDGAKAKFLSKPGKLFKYYILTLLLPIIAIAVVFTGILVNTGIANSSKIAGSGGAAILVLYLILILAIVPFIYFAYKWMINIGWKGYRVSWETKFWPSCAFLLGQILLLLITLGIYWPVLLISVYRYFAGKTIIRENGTEKKRLLFEGKTGTGFALLWGQSLLTLITLGIYLPWAYATCLRYFLNNTVVLEKQDRIGQR